jgi:hypothetical protein
MKAGEGMTDDLRATLTAIVDRVLPNLCSGYLDEAARRTVLTHMVTEAAEVARKERDAAIAALEVFVRESDCCYGGSCIAWDVEKRLIEMGRQPDNGK